MKLTFLKMIPLELTILYSADSYPNIYWDTNRNTTEWNVLMTELVLSGNELTQLKLEALLPHIPGAHVGKLAVLFLCPFPRLKILNLQPTSIRMDCSKTYSIVPQSF